MNYTRNDRGEMVIAVGAPGSIERAKVEWPNLIDNINFIWSQSYGLPGRCVDEAIELIQDCDVKSEMETKAILSASHYADELEGLIANTVYQSNFVAIYTKT